MSHGNCGESPSLESRLIHLQQTRKLVASALACYKRREQATARCWHIQGVLLHAVLAIWELSGGYAEPCVPFLEAAGRRRHWPDKAMNDIMTTVREVVEIAAEDDRASVRSSHVLRTAWEHVLQWRVAVWCLSMNVKKGIAVPTAIVVDEFRRRLRDIVIEVRFLDRGNGLCIAL
jgi:hypothetical protein